MLVAMSDAVSSASAYTGSGPLYGVFRVKHLAAVVSMRKLLMHDVMIPH